MAVEIPIGPSERTANKHPKAVTVGYLATMLAATTVLFAIVAAGIFVTLLMATMH